MRTVLSCRFALALFALLPCAAQAQIVTALPFQLQNNTVADATQVMANFNQIRNNTNSNAAKNGANSDITSLLGLTTPLSPSQGGSNVYVGGTSTGSANAQVVATLAPIGFSLVAGKRAVFKAGFTNTAATTLNINSTGALAVFRQTQLGPLAAVGGEIFVNAMVEVIYDGTQYQIVSPPVLVGEMKDYTGALPAGHLVSDGSCVSQTTYAALFTVLSTTWGSCSAGNFALPDVRGRVTAGLDASANRITPGGSSCDGNVLANGCGNQGANIGTAMGQTHLPNVTFPSTLGLGSVTVSIASGQNLTLTGGGALSASDLQSSGGVGSPHVYNLSGSISGSVTSGGSGTVLPVLNPVLITRKIIKY